MYRLGRLSLELLSTIYVRLSLEYDEVVLCDIPISQEGNVELEKCIRSHNRRVKTTVSPSTPRQMLFHNSIFPILCVYGIDLILILET